MTPTQIAAVSFAGLGALVWLTNLGLLVLARRGVPLLSRLRPPEPERWPLVSVVIPACNEAHTLEPALRSQLATDYPDVELVVVDDCSTDGTGALVDRLASQDPRLSAVHIQTLPDGWLGKVHALHVGQQRARGDWLLFADADTRIRPDTLRRMIAWCEAEGVDLVSPIARLTAPHPALDVAVGAFARLIFVASQPWRSADPSAKQAFGVGAFILVRRAALERSEGLPWLRLDVADDMALALVVKRAGGRLAVINARDHVELSLYTTFAELRRSTEKGGYSILGRYSVARTLAVALALPVLELAWVAGFLPVGVPWLPALGAAGLGMMCVATTAAAAWTGRAAWSGLLYPFGMLWMSALNVRSAIVCGRRGGIEWRGTFYPSALLRTGIRVSWP